MKKQRDKNELQNLCAGCKYGGKVLECCHCPELSPDIWDYVEPRIETLAEVQAALGACTQTMLKEHRAASYIAPAVTAISGKCKYYSPQATE